MSWTTLCTLDQLTEGKAIYVEIEGYQLAVYLHQGRPYVMDNFCPHAGGNMAAGYVEAGRAVCPLHHWAFDLSTGCLKDTTAACLHTYRVRTLDRPAQPMLVQADLPMP